MPSPARDMAKLGGGGSAAAGAEGVCRLDVRTESRSEGARGSSCMGQHTLSMWVRVTRLHYPLFAKTLACNSPLLMLGACAAHIRR
jgi:hypothetical protein